MFTRLLGVDGASADAHHLIGSLAITVAIAACAEVARPVRWSNVLLGLALVAHAFAGSGAGLGSVLSVAGGVALVALSVPRGTLRNRYGSLDAWLHRP